MAVPESVKEDVKEVGAALLKEVEPDQLALFELAFDEAAADEFRPATSDASHGFALGGAEVMAGTVATVIGKLFYDALKDAVKGELTAGLKQWATTRTKLTAAQRLKLLEEFDRTTKKLKLPDQDRLRLRTAVEKAL